MSVFKPRHCQAIRRETSVRDTLKRLHREGLTWPLPDTISDSELEQRLYGTPGKKAGRRTQSEPDWSAVARELKRKHVTLQVLWEEYLARIPMDTGIRDFVSCSETGKAGCLW
ncbi:hypothetical protein X741_32465 [Mesorhizobium sp. LNHC229A00]|nr:hypothetical protein X741_32465 [Mesorhizobium sp. LNHC229A00]